MLHRQQHVLTASRGVEAAASKLGGSQAQQILKYLLRDTYARRKAF